MLDDPNNTAAVPQEPARVARLEDIAARVGISLSEVSRVLNGKVREGRTIGRAKQDLIRQVAAEMNYKPNRAARSLRKGRTDTVALLVQTNATRDDLPPHYHEIVGALTQTLTRWGLHLLLVQCDDDPARSLETLARESICDAVILTDILREDPRVDLLESLGLPFVIRGSAPKEGLTAVGMDNAAVGYTAIEFLHRLGHRRILFHNIAQPLLSGYRRREGFESAVAELDLQETVRYTDAVSGEEDVYQMTLQLMPEPDPPTALFVADELAGLGVLRALADLEIAVPERVSVLACLNARFMRRVNPRLSFVNTRQYEVAMEAGVTVARILRGDPVEACQTFLSPILEDHGSCAPPPL